MGDFDAVRDCMRDGDGTSIADAIVRQVQQQQRDVIAQHRSKQLHVTVAQRVLAQLERLQRQERQQHGCHFLNVTFRNTALVKVDLVAAAGDDAESERGVTGVQKAIKRSFQLQNTFKQTDADTSLGAHPAAALLKCSSAGDVLC